MSTTAVGRHIEVSWEDQSNINLFNRLHVSHMELQAETKILKKKLEDLEDVSNELILVDDEEVSLNCNTMMVRYALGSSLFVHFSVEEADERVESRKKVYEEELERTNASIEEVESQMEQLKTILYAKFGNNINLEE